MKFITVTELRAQAPKIVSEVQTTGEEVVVTKNGKPVALIRPLEEDEFELKTKGLYKRGNVWWIRYAGLDGKVKQKSSRSISFRVAQSLLIKYKQEVLEGKEPIPVKPIKNHTLNQLAKQYLTWAERQRSFRSKKGFVKELLKEFGNIPLRQFNIMMLEEWQIKRLAYNKPATVNRHIGTLKHMFTEAVDWQMVEDDTLKKIRRVKLLPENNRRLRYLSMEELQSLIDACPPHLKPIVICAVNTEMRKEEILSLEWDKHIDLRHGFILLNVTKNRERRELPYQSTSQRDATEPCETYR